MLFGSSSAGEESVILSWLTTQSKHVSEWPAKKCVCPYLPDGRYAGLSACQDARVFSLSCCPRKCMCKILALLCVSAVDLQASKPVSAQVCYNTTLNNFFVWIGKGDSRLWGKGRKKTYCSRKEGAVYCR